MMSEPVEQQIPKDKVGFDHLADDLFGLSLRGIRTIRDAFVRPAKLFEAAHTQDWNGLYTPSIRLFSSLLVIIMFLRFIWAGSGSAIEDMFAAQMEMLAEQYDPVFAAPETLERIINTYFLIYPVTVVGIVFLASLVTFIWGKHSSLVTRIRLFFAAMIPNTAASSILVLLVGFVPYKMYVLSVLVPTLITMGLDFTTVFRGLAPVYSAGARLWRALLFSFITFACLLTASLVTQTAAGFWTGYSITKELQASQDVERPAELSGPETAEPDNPET